VRCLDGIRWQDICTEFHDDQFKHVNNVRSITATRGCNIGITDWMIYEVGR
jgi:hypothetical protein